MRKLLKGYVGRNMDLIWLIALVLSLMWAAESIKNHYGAGRWYALNSVRVEDGTKFDDLEISVDREIKMPFSGNYTVTVWPKDMSAPVCKGSDHVEYRKVSSTVISKTVGWWMGIQRPPCDSVIPAGVYAIETCVVVELQEWWLGWLKDPKVCRWSNLFTKKEI